MGSKDIDNNNRFLAGLKSCMRRGYSYIEGVEGLLIDLKKNGYEMHTSTNYPIWYIQIKGFSGSSEKH